MADSRAYAMAARRGRERRAVVHTCGAEVKCAQTSIGRASRSRSGIGHVVVIRTMYDRRADYARIVNILTTYAHARPAPGRQPSGSCPRGTRERGSEGWASGV